mmetsp:Transcript_100386/g.323583  ORF Transcript_100386/g.323583 Transcript_100386/m.323583 type:complete len:214 (+) Transcript_100386:3257-3898(+)
MLQRWPYGLMAVGIHLTRLAVSAWGPRRTLRRGGQAATPRHRQSMHRNVRKLMLERWTMCQRRLTRNYSGDECTRSEAIWTSLLFLKRPALRTLFWTSLPIASLLPAQSVKFHCLGKNWRKTEVSASRLFAALRALSRCIGCVAKDSIAVIGTLVERQMLFWICGRRSATMLQKWMTLVLRTGWHCSGDECKNSETIRSSLFFLERSMSRKRF